MPYLEISEALRLSVLATYLGFLREKKTTASERKEETDGCKPEIWTERARRRATVRGHTKASKEYGEHVKEQTHEETEKDKNNA